MKVDLDVFTQIGAFHVNNCEDYVFSAEVGTNQYLIAAMDGCTMGKDSQFASALMGKLLAKYAKTIYYKSFAEGIHYSSAQILYLSVKEVFDGLNRTKSMLFLEIEELLSTLIVAVVDVLLNKAEVIVVGDGVVCCNGIITEFEQGNKPDYLAYHLHEVFNDWWERQDQKLYYNDVKDISIATDGIFTFQSIRSEVEFSFDKDSIPFHLLIEEQNTRIESTLKKKVIRLEKEKGIKHTDDLGIVRLLI